jgi:hypothetical protein
MLLLLDNLQKKIISIYRNIKRIQKGMEDQIKS